MSYFKLATLMLVLIGHKSSMKFPELNSRPGLAHTNTFFHVRMAVGTQGSFSSASTSAGAFVEPLRVGSGLEDLQNF